MAVLAMAVLRLLIMFLVSVALTPCTNSFEMFSHFSSNFQNKKSNLNGADLNFVVFHFPPFDVLTLRPDGNYTHSGSNNELYDWLTKKLNFTISYFIIPNEITKAKYANLSDNAIIIHLIADKKMDASAIGFIATPERKSVMDFAYFIWTEPQAMLVPLPGEEPRLFAFIRPFQPLVWLFILISGITVVSSMSVFSKFYSKLFVKSVNDVVVNNTTAMMKWASQYSVYVVNTLTNQGGSVAVARLSFRILVGAWLLVAMVLVNSYSGTVISYLTVPKMKPPINTFEDLIASQEVELLLLADTVIEQQIRDAKTGVMKILGDQVRSNPDRTLSSVPKVNSRISTGRYAFPFLQTFSNNYVAMDFKKTGKCRFRTTDPLTMAKFWSLPLQKNSEFTPIFTYALMEVWETGLPSFWVKNAMCQAQKCLSKSKPLSSSRQVPIRLNDLDGAFLVLGIGGGLATFIFLIEKILQFKQRKPSDQSGNLGQENPGSFESNSHKSA